MFGIAKSIIRSSLARIGYKIVRAESQFLPALPQHRPWNQVLGDQLLVGHEPPYHKDADFQQTLSHLKREEFYALPLEYFPTWRLFTVWSVVRCSGRLNGDLVEFGTFRGGNAYVMLRSLELISTRKKLYLYDTFAGIPDQGLTERETQLGYAGRYSDTSVEEVAERLKDYEQQVEFRPGLIPSTLDDSGPECIAFMHVDLNAAQPTIDALNWAVPRWEKGGLCVLDDYLEHDYEDQRELVDRFFSDRKLQIISIPTGQGLVINQGVQPRGNSAASEAVMLDHPRT